MDRRKSGTEGENAAVDLLLKKGYRIIERNFRFERGEIDIVAEHHDTLVFVEVKTRRTKHYGEPEDAVTPHKRGQIRKVAEGYLFQHNIEGKECRFDVVAVQLDDAGRNIRHYENAF